MQKLIVIEGACDGIGKTTQYNKLYEHLINDGEKVIKHHFPSYNTTQGLPVEKYLKGEYGSQDKLSPFFINRLYALDRAVTWYAKLKELYENGYNILLDRYTTSSLFYQSALMKTEEEKIAFINHVNFFEYEELAIKKPDQIIFLTAPYDLITKLRTTRENNDGIKNDIHESNKEFMKKVYDNAIFMANYLKWDIVECNNNNKMKNIDEIHDEVYRLIRKK